MVDGSGFSLDSHNVWCWLVRIGEKRVEGLRQLLWTATKSLRLSEEIICGPLFGGSAAVSNTTVAVRCLHWHSLH